MVWGPGLKAFEFRVEGIGLGLGFWDLWFRVRV